MKLFNFNIISPQELTHTDKTEKCPFFTTFMHKTHVQHHISEKKKSKHWAWPMPHFHTQVTWVWHIPKYEDNHADTFLPNIKCQTPHMLKCLYSPKQNVKYYLTSLHINEWTLAFTLTWPKTSSVHFLFPLFHPWVIFPLWYTILTNTTKSARNHALINSSKFQYQGDQCHVCALHPNHITSPHYECK